MSKLDAGRLTGLHVPSYEQYQLGTLYGYASWYEMAQATVAVLPYLRDASEYVAIALENTSGGQVVIQHKVPAVVAQAP